MQSTMPGQIFVALCSADQHTATTTEIATTKTRSKIKTVSHVCAFSFSLLAGGALATFLHVEFSKYIFAFVFVVLISLNNKKKINQEININVI